MKQFEQSRFIRMVNQTMVFTARRFLIPAALQFVVVTRHYNALCFAGNKNQRTLNPIQPRFQESVRGQPPRLAHFIIATQGRKTFDTAKYTV
jgi:hypothetical protein